MTSLYNLKANYQRLMELDVYSEEDLQLLEQLPDLLEDKLIQYGYVIRNLEYLIASINCEMSNMLDRRNKLQKNLETLQKLCISAMQAGNISKIDKCPHFKMAVHKKRSKVDPYDKKSIPEDFWIIEEKPTMKLNTDLLHSVLEDGEEVPGARLVDPYRLVIK